MPSRNMLPGEDEHPLSAGDALPSAGDGAEGNGAAVGRALRARAAHETYLADPKTRIACLAMIGLVLLEAGSVLLFGWIGGIDILTRFVGGFPAMVPSTATALILLSLPLWADLWPANRVARGWVTHGAALFVTALAAANLSLRWTGNWTGIDQFLWPQEDLFASDSMSVATSVCAISAAACFLIAPLRRRHPLAFTAFATTGFLFAASGVNAFVFNSQSFYWPFFYSNLSLPTAIGFSLVFVVILVRYGDVGWVPLLLDKGPGGQTARSLLPAVIGIPLILSFISYRLYSSEILDARFLMSAMSVATTCLLAVLVLHASRKVADAQDELLLAMDEVSKARDQARAAEMAKSSFLANMSHELRTPMNAVLGFTDLMLRSDHTPEQRQRLELISESGSSMMSLLDSILDLSKIESGNVVPEMTPVDLHHLLNRSVRFLRGASSHKGLDLRLSIEPDVPRYIVGDKLRLLQILNNLIGNAIKFTPAGWVSVSARVVEGDGAGEIEIAVVDTGIGIAPDKRDEIFGEFSQVDGTISRRFGGTGLGLSISRRLAALLNGSIRFESELGKGSTFYLRLPLVEASPDEIEEPSGQRAERGGGPAAEGAPKGRILVAEDHEINRALISSQLESLGYSFDLVNDGDQAVVKVKEKISEGQPYALVLMDIQMPDVDGIEATRRIRESGVDAETLPIVALTAHAFEEEVEACRAAGMQDHIAKPLRLDELQAKLSRWMRAQPPQAPQAPQASPQAPAQTAGAGQPERSRALSASYGAFRGEVLSMLEQCLHSWPDGEDRRLEELAGKLHKFAGTAALFDEPELGELARRLDGEIGNPLADRNSLEAMMREFLRQAGAGGPDGPGKAPISSSP